MVRRQIAYVDALKILGAEDSRLLAVIDRLLGGAILVGASATGHLELLSLLHSRDELVKQTGKLLSGFGLRVRGARQTSRAELLVAAHAVVAVNAYFEALRSLKLPVDPDRLQLTSADQLAVAGAPLELRSRKLAAALIGTPVPRPTSQRPYEEAVLDLKIWYATMSQRLVNFIQGLEVWDELNETQRSRFRDALIKDLPVHALAEYEDGFRRLAAESREFELWIGLTDSLASRSHMTKIGTELKADVTGLHEQVHDLVAASVEAANYAMTFDNWITRESASALHAMQDACRAAGTLTYTAHVLLALLEIPAGFAETCLDAVSPTLAAVLQERLKAYIGSLSSAEAGPYREFAWVERPEVIVARQLAADAGRTVVDDGHLFRAILAGDSVTREQLRQLLGPQDLLIVKVAEHLSTHWPPPTPPTPGQVWDSE